MRRFFFGCFLSFVVLCGISCSVDNNAYSFGSRETIKIVSWNVQTFFDATSDGTEYADFLKNKNWNIEMYSKRVKRLCQVMTQIDADVYVFEEIENEAVIQDICNELAGKKWDSKSNWNYACFSKEKGSSIGCAVISKFELSDFTTHNIDIRTIEKEQPSLRAIGEICVNVGKHQFFLFVNHWKSKNSGETETEIWRKKQEELLVSLVSQRIKLNETCPILICGDFNKDIEEFEIVEKTIEGNVILRNFCNGNRQKLIVYSPWYDDDGKFVSDTGSYFYKDAWERIDNFFVCNNFAVIDFEPCVDEQWTKEDNIPFAFRVYTGEGYSDHLPIKITLKF